MNHLHVVVINFLNWQLFYLLKEQTKSKLPTGLINRWYLKKKVFKANSPLVLGFHSYTARMNF